MVEVVAQGETALLPEKEPTPEPTRHDDRKLGARLYYIQLRAWEGGVFLAQDEDRPMGKAVTACADTPIAEAAVVGELAGVHAADRVDSFRMSTRRKVAALDVLYALIAALLLTAVVGKGIGFANGPAGRRTHAVLSHLFVIEGEGALAIWLLSGFWRRWCNRVVVCFFILAACISTSMGLRAERSCGCFGDMTLSPWAAAAMDVVLALGVLTAGSVVRSADNGPCRRIAATSMGQMALSGAAVLLIAYGIAIAAFGSPNDVIAWLGGQRVRVEPRLIDLGECHLGDNRTVGLDVSNAEDRPVEIVGATTTCNGCRLADAPV